MTLTFILRAPCAVCGYENHGVIVHGDCRVNKTSLRVGDGFGFTPRGKCRECGQPADTDRVRRVLDPESQQKVDAFRARKGWAA